jgi:hypothetical protein
MSNLIKSDYYKSELKRVFDTVKDEELSLKIISDRFTTKWLSLNEESIPVIIDELNKYLTKLKNND